LATELLSQDFRCGLVTARDNVDAGNRSQYSVRQ
jgi:hypothetical protein